MNKQQQVLRILKIAGKHGMNKLFAARELHVFGLGDIISRLRRKGYKIETSIVCQNKAQSHVKYILSGGRSNIGRRPPRIIPDITGVIQSYPDLIWAPNGA